MRIHLSILVLSSGLLCPGCVSPGPVGTYRQCLIACQEIILRPDHTLRYQPMSDVGAPQYYEGRWESRGDFILAEPIPDEAVLLASSADESTPGVVVTVRDIGKDAVVPWTAVWIEAEGGEHESTTDAQGVARFPPCRPRRILIDISGEYSATYHVDGSQGHNRFELATERNSIGFRLLMVRHRKLYILEQVPLQRVSRSTTGDARGRPNTKF